MRTLSELKLNHSADRAPDSTLASQGDDPRSDGDDPRSDGAQRTGVEAEGEDIPLVVASGAVTTGQPALAHPRPDVPSSRPSHDPLRLRLLALDVATVLLCWVALGYVVAARGDALRRLGPGLVAAVATLLAFAATGLYDSRVSAQRPDELFRVAFGSMVGGAAFIWFQWQLGLRGLPVIVCLVACMAVAASSRRQFGRWLRTQRTHGRHARGVLLVGANEDASRLGTMLRAEPELGYVVEGIVGNGDAAGDGLPWNDVPTSSSISEIPTFAETTRASGVLIVPSALSSADTSRAIAVATAAHLHVELWPALDGVGSRRVRLVPVSGEAFLSVEPKTVSRTQLTLKRAMDIAGAVVGLVLTAPLLVVAAILVKLDSPGPVLHRGVRIGMKDKPFVAYKLRSMRASSDPATALSSINERTDGPLFKSSHDPRVTRLGRLLRSSSVDELPQLWNVLTGTMSLVGPRPALPDEVAQFDEDLLRRHSMRPGITGLWQIEARHNPSFHAYRRLDLSYVDNWSLAVDMAILAATVPAVVSQAVRELRRRRRA